MITKTDWNFAEAEQKKNLALQNNRLLQEEIKNFIKDFTTFTNLNPNIYTADQKKKF